GPVPQISTRSLSISFKLNPVASGMQPGRNYSRQKLGILGAAACLIPYRLLGEGNMYLTEQKDELVRRLDGTRDGLMATVAGLTEVQSNFKPSPEGWSISGIVEHLAIVEDLVILRVEQLAAGSGDSPNGKFNESDA